MSKGQNVTDYTILLGCIGGLFTVCTALALWILNNINSYVKKLYGEIYNLIGEVEKLKGTCEERHKKK